MDLLTVSLLAYAVTVTAALCYVFYQKHLPKITVANEIPVCKMPVNSSGWMVPWAFSSDGGVVYVNGGHTVHPNKGGTVSVKIVRRFWGVEVLEWPSERLISEGRPSYNALRVFNMEANDREPTMEPDYQMATRITTGIKK